MKIVINSQISFGEKLKEYTTEQIKNEPMLFSCDYESAYVMGDIITREFLSKLPEDWKNNDTIIDSRVHMLMKGWYPCIPGFHHDDVPREREDGQPEYFNPSYRSEHIMALHGGDICPTQFALGESEFECVDLGNIIYKEWHKEVCDKVNSQELSIIKAPSNIMIHFNDRTWHQGVKATDNGWRWFGRASRNTGRKPTNELRKQVQVYLENPMEGW